MGVVGPALENYRDISPSLSNGNTSKRPLLNGINQRSNCAMRFSQFFRSVSDSLFVSISDRLVKGRLNIKFGACCRVYFFDWNFERNGTD